jgi:WD40 repeat protein
MVFHKRSASVWFVQDLQRSPLILNNDASTWGIATFGQRHLLAVSANSHDITVWSLCYRTTREPDRLQTEVTATEPIGGSSQDDKILLKGHEHNVPSIDFSLCGRYLASASLDGSCRIWAVQSARVSCLRTIDPDAW